MRPSSEGGTRPPDLPTFLRPSREELQKVRERLLQCGNQLLLHQFGITGMVNDGLLTGDIHGFHLWWAYCNRPNRLGHWAPSWAPVESILLRLLQ